MGRNNIIQSDKIVEVTPILPVYGTVEVHTNHIIAVNKERHTIYFECTAWKLTEDDFNKVYDSWNRNA